MERPSFERVVPKYLRLLNSSDYPVHINLRFDVAIDCNFALVSAGLHSTYV